VATNLALDDRLIQEAQQAGNHRTKRAAVTEALEEYVRYRRQLRALELFGTIEYDPGYDPRRQRHRK
jgi:Arc/MetJ family transcription regulator